MYNTRPNNNKPNNNNNNNNNNTETDREKCMQKQQNHCLQLPTESKALQKVLETFSEFDRLQKNPNQTYSHSY